MTRQTTYWMRRLEQEGLIWRFRGGPYHAAYDLTDRHSGFYFNTDLALSQPVLRNDILNDLQKLIQDEGTGTWIVTHTSSVSASLILASIAASNLQRRLAYLSDSSSSFRFPISSGDSLQVVTDDIHSGSSIKRLLAAARYAKAAVLSPLVAIANFSGKDEIEGYPIRTLFAESIDIWHPSECPFCAAGSVPLNARASWSQLVSSRPA